MDKEEARFRQKFKEFPSSFNIEIKELMSSKEKKLQKKKLEENIKSHEYESDTELIRVYNLLSFLHWIANEREVAYNYNRKALDLDRENLVSLSNRVWMRREEGKLTDANDKLTKLLKLAESKYNLLLLGRGEIAYCYSVFGSSYLLKSKDMLEDLVRDKDVKDIDPIILTLWKFDLGIIYRKLCNSGNMPRQGWENRNEEECIKRGIELLYEVACSDCSARWRARCWASLAELMYTISKDGRLNTYGIEELLPKEIKENNIERLLDLAMETCDEDSRALKIIGKLYRYLKQLEKSEDVLRKSLAKEKTSYSHHHLALVLKQKLKNKLFKKKLNNVGNGNRRNTVNRYIRHKTFLAKHETQEAKGSNILSQPCTRDDNSYSQDLPQANVKTTVSRNEKPISSTVVTGESTNSSTKEAASILQYPNTKQTRALAKGFDRVFSIPEDEEETVREILYHLDEAIKLGNGWASLEKGIVLRQVKKYEEACNTFLTTLKMEGDISPIQEVSCYENLGACCRDIADQETDLKRKRKREIDAVIYWRKALEKIASKESKTLNFPKEEWMSYPVLKDMFQHRQLDIATLKALAELGEILERPAETRSYYREIFQLDEKEANDPTIICSEIKTLLKENLFEEADQLLQRKQEENIPISKAFCTFVYLECAFYFASIGKAEKSSKLFRQALYTGVESSIDMDKSIEESCFDIFLLCDEDTEEDKAIFVLAEKLEKILSDNFGLRITINSRTVDPRKQRWVEQVKQMESSNNIVLLLDTDEEPRGYLEYFIGIAQEISRKKNSILKIILVDECTCPFQLAVFPIIHFESKRLESKDDFIQWIRDFVFHLFHVDDMEE